MIDPHTKPRVLLKKFGVKEVVGRDSTIIGVECLNHTPNLLCTPLRPVTDRIPTCHRSSTELGFGVNIVR